MKFRISKNPYDERAMFKKAILELNPNTISCFVGANGTGKTTAIRFIKNHLHKIGHDIENDHNQFYKIFNEDGDQIQVKIKDYGTCLFHSNQIVLIESKCPFCGH